MDDLDARSKRTLRLIADIMRTPIGRFFADEGPPDPSGAQECLRLWFMIATDEGRARALAALHSVIDAERDQPVRLPPLSD